MIRDTDSLNIDDWYDSKNSMHSPVMREEWTALSLPDFEKKLEATDEMDDLSFDRMLKTAIARLKVCRQPSGKDGPWSVFSSKREEWVAGFEAPAQIDRTVH